MEKANMDIRNELTKAKIPFWYIGDVLGVGELTVIRRLRHELSAADKQKIRDIIKEVESKGITQ